MVGGMIEDKVSMDVRDDLELGLGLGLGDGACDEIGGGVGVTVRLEVGDKLATGLTTMSLLEKLLYKTAGGKSCPVVGQRMSTGVTRVGEPF